MTLSMLSVSVNEGQRAAWDESEKVWKTLSHSHSLARPTPRHRLKATPDSSELPNTQHLSIVKPRSTLRQCSSGTKEASKAELLMFQDMLNHVAECMKGEAM